ncbi:MAG: hypothetical protein ACRDTD_25125 [Pseudonocardiaceae bacterium]
MTGADAVEVLRARARQLSHDQARLLAAMVEAGCVPRTPVQWPEWAARRYATAGGSGT